MQQLTTYCTKHGKDIEKPEAIVETMQKIFQSDFSSCDGKKNAQPLFELYILAINLTLEKGGRLSGDLKGLQEQRDAIQYYMASDNHQLSLPTHTKLIARIKEWAELNPKYAKAKKEPISAKIYPPII